jgi:hypothetical protein
MEFIRSAQDQQSFAAYRYSRFMALPLRQKLRWLSASVLLSLILLVSLIEARSSPKLLTENSSDEQPITYQVFQTSDLDFSPDKLHLDSGGAVFLPVDNNYVNLGKREVLWLKINLTNYHDGQSQARNAILVIKRNGIYTPAELYFQTKQTKQTKQTNQSNVREGNRWRKQVFNASAQFHNHLVAGLAQDLSSTTLYVKLSGQYLRASIDILSQPAFFTDLQNNALLDGLFYGILVLFILYNMMLYIRLKTQSYLAYSALLLVLCLWFLSGQGWLSYVWPQVQFIQHSTVLLGALLALAIAEFAKHYLQIKTLSKPLLLILTVSQCLLVLLLLVRFTLAEYLSQPLAKLAYVFGLMLIFCIIVACLGSAILAVTRHRGAAWYYLVATSLFFVMLILMGLSAGNVINMHFSWQLLQVTSAIEVLIYSAGLVAIYHQQQLKNQTMQAALTQAQASLVKQLEISNALKDKVLSNAIEPKLFPELAKLTKLLPSVLYVRAMGNYCSVIYKTNQSKKKLELECSLQNLVDSFGNEFFVRTHKSYLINPTQGFYLQRRTSADYDLNMMNELLPVGRKYLADIKARL